MTKNPQQRQEGQTLVQVAILMVVLLAFAALAIDFGRIYLERRFLQNAADAGALAGARAMCFDGKTYAEATAPGGPAETFAKQNVPASNLAGTTVSFPPAGTGVVQVTAEEDALPTFMGAVIGILPGSGGVGMNTVKVGATAAAACGPANTVCGLFPIAFDKSAFDQQLRNICGKEFYVWTGDDDVDPCSQCNCDTNGDGEKDIFTNLSRGWVDFTGSVADPLYPTNCAKPGCGTSEIKCWILADDPAPITIPACIGGDRGIKAGAKTQIDARAGAIVRIPLFDSSCGSPNSCKEGFHVVDFGCVKVIGWEQNKQLYYPPPNSTTKCMKPKLVHVAVSCDKACNTACGSTSGGGCPPGSSVCAVNLIE